MKIIIAQLNKTSKSTTLEIKFNSFYIYKTILTYEFLKCIVFVVQLKIYFLFTKLYL